MYKSLSWKRFSWFSVLIGYLLTVVFGLALLITPAPAYAQTTDLGVLCIPPTNTRSGNRREASGWLQLRVINRATFELIMTPAGRNCDSPNGLDLGAINSADGPGSFTQIVNSTLVDVNIDDDFDFRASNGNADNEDTRIDNFGDFPSGARIASAYSGTLTTAQINDMFGNIELTLGIEEDLVPAVACDGLDDNSNLALSVNGDGNLEWSCVDDSIDSLRGINIALSDIQSIGNFNITYGISDDAQFINYLSANSPSNQSFQWCGAESTPVYRNGCLDGDLEIRNFTQEDLLTRQNQSDIELDITQISSGSVVGTVIAAGADTQQGQPNNGLIGGGVDQDGSCEANGGAFSFVICPALEFADGAIATLDGRIFEALYIGEENYSDSGLKESWARIRNVGYILLIPVMLIMVIGTALGFSFLDAYTVKRAIPRMFAAIIFMALSYNICIIAINIVNGVGQGVAGLITAPFGGLENLQLTDLFNPSATDTAAGLAIGVGALFAVAGSIGIGIVLSYMFVAALVLLVIFVLLALRRVLIVALILLAPLAIISWIFPGNDKLWKLWYNSFTKLLYLFPIIIALLASGRVFAEVVQDSATGYFGTIIKLTAFVGPYFLIPAAFKFAGGAFGNLAGMANDRSKGVFDRQRKKRGQMAAENRQKSDNFSRFSDNNVFGRKANTVIGATRKRNLKQIARTPGDIGGGINRARATGQAVQGAEEWKNDPTVRANENDDNFLIALANRDLAETKLSKDQDKYNDAEKIFNDSSSTQQQKDEAKTEMRGKEASIQARQNGLAAASQVKGNKTNAVRRQALNAWMKSGYNISGGEEGYNEIASTVNDIAGGDLRARSAMMDEAQYHVKNAGHAHLGGINHGAGYDPAAGIKKAGLYQLAGGKTEAIQGWGEDVLNSGDTNKMAIHLSELKSMQPNTNGANRDEVNKQIAQLEANSFLQQSMQQRTGNMTNVQKRVDYNAGRAATDPTYAASVAGWTTEDKNRGWRTETKTVHETRGDLARKEARAYEAPDPNKIEN